MAFVARKLLLDLLVLPEYKPIGGDGDGEMERKEEVRCVGYPD
jgi:hypothetical protein